jgi:CheY-like chemotaxis protein
MPRMDGFEVLASLRQAYPELPVIVMSAGGEGVLDQATLAMYSKLQQGVGRLFDKTIHTKELAAAVDELLGRRG